MAPSPLPQADRPAARRLVARLFRFPDWAHHPLCTCFDGHLLRLGPLAVCLGCACLAIGALSSMLALMGAWQHEPWLLHGWGLFAAGMLCWLPTLAQPFCQHKGFKAASRFLLGAALPCLLLAGLVLPPLTPTGLALRLGFVALFVGCFVLASRLRRRFTPDPCATCPHGSWPLCAGNLPRVRKLLAEARAEVPGFVLALETLIEENPALALRELGRCRSRP